MSKYCMKCGKQIEEKDLHCPYCGAVQENNFEVKDLSSQKENKQKDVLVPIVAVCAVILVVIIVVLNLFVFNKGYESPIESLFDAIESEDVDDLEDALPDYLIDSDDYDDDSGQSMLKMLSASVEMIYGDDFDISYKVLDKKSIEKDELKDLEKSIKKEYNEKADVDKGYKVKIQAIIEGDKTSNKNETTINIYKIDGKWCITDSSLKGLY